MNRVLILAALLITSSFTLKAQDQDLIARYRASQQKVIEQYEAEREATIADYAQAVRNAWEWYKTMPVIPRPKRQKVPPVIMDPEDNKKPFDNKEQPIEDVITPTLPQDDPKPQPKPNPEPENNPQPQPNPKPETEPQPEPNPQPKTEPQPQIEPQPQPNPRPQTEPQPQKDPVIQLDNPPIPSPYSYEFDYFGTPLKVRLKNSQKVNLKSVNRNKVADALEKIDTKDFDNTVEDCIRLGNELQLCDWAYYKMLDALCDSFYGKDTNESELVKAYLYFRSGYAMLMCISEGKLRMLYGTKHQVYDLPGVSMGGINYYPETDIATSVELCPVVFPYENTMSLTIPSLPLLSKNISKDREFKMPDQNTLTLNSNLNLMSFFETYPTSRLGENNVSRWALYANTPLSDEMVRQLYPELRSLINGKSTSEAVDLLCSWIQKSFVYEYDDVIWGRDRAFFADESLYYPYADCEDRSILLTRIARDLLGVECLLVFYPNHLATAIALGNDVEGDYISLGGKKYIICDPTYIGASIGRTMPNMNNSTAQVIVL